MILPLSARRVVSRLGRFLLVCAVFGLCLGLASCSASRPELPWGYMEALDEMTVVELKAEHGRLAREIAFLNDRLGEIAASDAARSDSGRRRMNGLRQWRDLARSQMSRVDELLASGKAPSHLVRRPVSREVVRASRAARESVADASGSKISSDADARPGPADSAPSASHSSRPGLDLKWKDIPPVPDSGSTGAVNPAVSGKAVARADGITWESAGDKLTVRVRTTGEPSYSVRREDNPPALALILDGVAPASPASGRVALDQVRELKTRVAAKPSSKIRASSKKRAMSRDTVRGRGAVRTGDSARVTGPASLVDITHKAVGSGLDVTVSLSSPSPKMRWFRLDNPPRVVLDFYGMEPPERGFSTRSLESPLARRIRTGWHQSQRKLRVVVDTASPAPDLTVARQPLGAVIRLR